MLFNIIIVFIINLLINSAQSDHDNWFGRKELSDNYTLMWKLDQINEQLLVRVEVRTKGWIGFGFSKHGLMSESDLIIGWVTDNGQTLFNVSLIIRLGTLGLRMLYI
jgi:hypothetical protein